MQYVQACFKPWFQRHFLLVECRIMMFSAILIMSQIWPYKAHVVMVYMNI